MVIESVGNCPPVLASKGEMPMSGLSIVVGGWLLLNAVVFAALMLRQDRSVLRDRLFRWAVGDEVHDRPGDLAAVGASTHELNHVEGPALGGVESGGAMSASGQAKSPNLPAKSSRTRAVLRILPITHHCGRLSVPIEIRPHICGLCATLAASAAPTCGRISIGTRSPSR